MCHLSKQLKWLSWVLAQKKWHRVYPWLIYHTVCCKRIWMFPKTRVLLWNLIPHSKLVDFFCFLPWHIDRRRCFQLSSTDATLLHWVPTFVTTWIVMQFATAETLQWILLLSWILSGDYCRIVCGQVPIGGSSHHYHDVICLVMSLLWGAGHSYRDVICPVKSLLWGGGPCYRDVICPVMSLGFLWGGGPRYHDFVCPVMSLGLLWGGGPCHHDVICPVMSLLWGGSSDEFGFAVRWWTLLPWRGLSSDEFEFAVMSLGVLWGGGRLLIVGWVCCVCSVWSTPSWLTRWKKRHTTRNTCLALISTSWTCAIRLSYRVAAIMHSSSVSSGQFSVMSSHSRLFSAE